MPKQLFAVTMSPALALLLAVFSPVYAVDSTAAKAAFQFLEEPASPGLIAMGNAGTAMKGIGFSYYNPAQPFFTDASGLSIGYAPLPGDLTAICAEGSWRFSNTFLGMHLSNHAVGTIYPATEQEANYSTPFSAGFTLVSLDAGYYGGRHSFALAVNGMQDRIWTATAYGVSISAGGAYWIVPQKLSLGAAVFHLGTTTGYTDATQHWGDGERLPRSGRIGAAYTDTVKHIPFSVACDVVYRDVGDKLLSAKGALPRITVPLGVELWPSQYVAVRLGKRFNFETELVNFGAGLRYSSLLFDMSFVITKLYDDVEVNPMFALTYTVARARSSGETGVIKTPEVEIKSSDTVPLRPIEAPKMPPAKDSLAAPDTTINDVPSQESVQDTAEAPRDTLQLPNSGRDKELPVIPPAHGAPKREPDDPGAATNPPKKQ
jgi:hypothetical protein